MGLLLAVFVSGQPAVGLGSADDWKVSVWSLPHVSTDWATPGEIYIDHQAGEMFLVDARANRVRILDRQGFERFGFRSGSLDPRTGLPNGQPHDVAVTPRGDVYMTDFSATAISLLDFRGERVATIEPAVLLGRTGARIRAESLALTPDGLVYATISGDQTGIICFDQQGRLVRTVATELDGPGRINQPAAFALGPDGSLWVADQLGYPVIKHYSPDGQYLGGFGGRDMARTDFSLPTDMLIGADGSVWVADALRQVVKHFTPAGQFIEMLGGYGFNPGEMQNPVGLAGDGVDTLFVCERVGRRIQRFSRIAGTGPAGASVVP